MIWIRADGGKEIGTGHIMRCLSVADALSRMGEPVCFLVADTSAEPFLIKCGQEYRVLNSDFRKMEDELETLLPLLSGGEKSVFLADSYFVTDSYLNRIRKYMPVCYMDDRGISGLPVDMLINYNIFADPSLYGAAGSEGISFLLGMEYTPLRREFQDVPYQVRDRVRRVLITTGGSDRYDLAGRILEEVLQMPEIENLEYCVVSGAYNEHLPELQRMAEGHRGVRVFSNVADMAELMRTCDIAVTAGGSTMYELSAVGVPMICFSFVDNQEKIVEGFRDRKLVCFGGDYLRQGKQMVRDVAEHIALLCRDEKLRRRYSECQRKLVDGQGALRIAERLCELKDRQRIGKGLV